MNPKVDIYISKNDRWQEEMIKLRQIMLDCDLIEELKWGVPCYMYGKSNVAILHGFKEYCAILFVKGALLQDADGILIRQSENVQAGRQVRFSHVSQIVALETTLNAYVYEAIVIEKEGLKVSMKKSSDYAVPEEFQNQLNESATLRTAFEALTPGRQRAYLLYFGAPKQSKTREARVEKCIAQILDGKGLND